MVKNGYPREWIVYDTETSEHKRHGGYEGVELRLRLGVAKRHTGDMGDDGPLDVLRFTAADEFFAWVRQRPKVSEPIYIFAHNHGFDARVIGLFKRIEAGEHRFEPPYRRTGNGPHDRILCVIENPPMIVKTYDDRGQEYMWLDTYQWISQSLKSIGEQLGFPKGVMPSLDEPDEVWFPYCEQDVDVLIRALKHVWEWLAKLGVKTWKPTRAGQAMEIFTSLYQGSEVERPCDQEPADLSRIGYYGGYTQCLFQGRTRCNIHQYDVNSLYPYVMGANAYPVSLVKFHQGTKVLPPQIIKDPISYIAEVFVDHPSMEFPYRTKDGTYWVTGRHRTVLCGPELLAAYQADAVKGVGSFARFNLSYIFTDFVNDFHGMKVEAEEDGRLMDRLIIKLMMNSLYGKYGQKEHKWYKIGTCDDRTKFQRGQIIDAVGGYLGEILILCGNVYRSVGVSDAKCSYPPIAAYCTSYARDYMRRIRDAIGMEHVYYQATDSLHLDGVGKAYLDANGLVNSYELGKFKYEGVFDYIDYRNVHFYDTPTKKLRGSVRKGAVLLSGTTYRTERWQSLRSALNAGNLDHVVIEPFVKTLQSRVTTRRPRKDGFCVPYHVNTWAYTLGTLGSSKPHIQSCFGI